VHDNCSGFCVRSGLAQFKLLYEKRPEVYNKHVEREKQIRIKHPKVRPFLRKTINGKIHYLWLEDYRTMLQNGLTLNRDDKFDFGGCGCII